MNKAESLEHFINTEVKKVSENQLVKLEEYYQENKEELKKDFLINFLDICKSVKHKENIAYIVYSMIRIDIMQKNNIYLVEVSDEICFLDKEKIVFEYSAHWAFKYLDEFEEELSKIRKLYMGKIGQYHVENLKLEESRKYNEYIIALARYSLKDIENVKEFKEINLNEQLEIKVGEYRDIAEIVYKEDVREKKDFIIKELFEEKDEDDVYSYQVYKGLNLNNGDYMGLDFSFCNFSKSNLESSDISRCMLIGVNFKNATLENINMRNSLIYESNFNSANLKGAELTELKGSKGKANAKEDCLKRLIFEAVDFRNSNLENVIFDYSEFKGADFRGAKFNNTSFYKVDLEGAVFSNESKEQLSLSEKQIKEIIWEEI